MYEISVLEGILLRQVQEALQGKTRAAESLLDRYERCAGMGEAKREELPEEDLAVLERAIGHRGTSAGKTEPTPEPGQHLIEPVDGTVSSATQSRMIKSGGSSLERRPFVLNRAGNSQIGAVLTL